MGELLVPLPEESLREWFVAQRWFGSKATDVAHLNILESFTLRDDTPQLVLALIEARCSHTGSRGAVKQGLLDHDGRPKVVERLGMIEGAEREIGGRELALRQQRAEDEHRLIATLPRLDHIDLGQIARPRLPDALGRLTLHSRGAAGVGVLCAGASDGLRQGQWGLGGGRYGKPQCSHEEVGRRASYHLFDRIHET
jgi:hypothetical protein